ncbi:alpha-hydroxy acid oxidase [Zwartia vadi]|uniref:alpha-hydroxy acid oxidase n=1 Tax=Zwartia vadi TaxID=3058168 RepID=UPI0025B61C73|nr:alpha-hydroxy acid oxidase [Zwartia vadi]MDN3987279.1 alpha-hydroxy acid oxidase [Zwartia vadi]
MPKPINLHDYRALAQRRLPKIAFDFIDGGADDERGMLRNREAFSQYQLLPRYLIDITNRDQSVELFGRKYASPIGISPTGMAGLFRTGADAMLAAAAKKANVPFLLSSASNLSIEDAAKIAPDNVWFQMYATSDPRINHDLVKRARDANVGVLVITVDVPVNSNRERNRRNGFTRPFRMTPAIMLDALTKPGWVIEYLKAGGMPMMSNWQPYAKPGASADEVADMYGTLTPAAMTDWDTVASIRQQWSGPLVIKGLLHPEDAAQAVAIGAQGIIVSNHGARQLDSAPSPLTMLAEIKAAVGEQVSLMVDSGVRRGSDVVIAKCLGAKSCFFGRPTLYAVSALGQEGADQVLAIMHKEIDMILTQIGCGQFDKLDSRFLVQRPGR